MLNTADRITEWINMTLYLGVTLYLYRTMRQTQHAHTHQRTHHIPIRLARKAFIGFLSLFMLGM